MISRNEENGKYRLYCDECGIRVSRWTFSGDDGLEFGRPEQILCEECHDRIWRNLRRGGCPRCYTQPCMHGRDCWINPFPRIMYLCHIGKRLEYYHSAVRDGMQLLEGVIA